MDVHATLDAYTGKRHEYSEDKERVDAIEQAELANADRPITRLEAPPLIREMSKERRQELEKLLVRKVDFRLLPAVITMYIMNYLDRNNIASARLAGLQTELNLTSTQYQTSVSILFVGYLLMQIPSNLLLNKIGLPAIYLPTVMIIWGCISGATAAVQSYGGLVAVRFMLGFVEVSIAKSI